MKMEWFQLRVLPPPFKRRSEHFTMRSFFTRCRQLRHFPYREYKRLAFASRILAQTLRAMKRARPGILPEFFERIALLQKELPLSEHAQGAVQGVLDDALAT